MSLLEQLLGVPFEDHDFLSMHGKLHYVTLGNKERLPLVFFHGANMGIGQWFPNLAALAPFYHVYAIDMYNAGTSTTLPAEEQVPAVYKEAALAFVSQCVNGRPVLIGHSFGGWIALEIACTMPHAVRGLVLVDTIGVANRIPWRERLLQIPLLRTILLATILRPSETHVRRFLQDGYRKGHIPNERFVDYVLGHALIAANERSPFRFAGMMMKNFSKLKQEKGLISSEIPTLMIAGENDIMSDLPRLHTLLREHDMINLEIITAAGHVPSLEQPEQFNAAVRGFLEKLSHA
ncbi:MAG TPA: alpha/beta hydrolase [Candidatus Paceibacterota bacterium]